MKTDRERFDKLFYTPLLRYRVANPDQLNTALLAEAATMRAATEGLSKSNRGGWHSEGNLFDQGAAAISALRSAVESALEDANKAIGAKAKSDDLRLKLFGWMNANPKGAFNAPHTHPGAHWSGVYYVAQPDVDEGNSGMIEFVDARTDLPNWRILKAAPYRLKKKMRPEPGEIILFPSYLVHWVYPNETDGERVSIAFNATYKTARK
ncbi:MAG: TIGR02466 family protein [Paracoccaceae bacterium]|uniref:TIGR02466 family protein n=1 Tax=Yoonia sp. TaxID=2212373 RepID=UPI0032890372